ncbi:MAG: hypothetical protein ACFB5Z_04935 [Elainellaceae cyanobacterium]
MRIIKPKVNISDDHRLSIQLPEDIAEGTYQVLQDAYTAMLTAQQREIVDLLSVLSSE